jgi:hypothetical protein
MIADLKSKFEAIRDRLDRSLQPKRVYVMEYFDITHGRDSTYCDDHWRFERHRILGPNWAAWLRMFPNSRDAEDAYEKVIVPLNTNIKNFLTETQFKKDGWEFLSGIAKPAGNKGWCANPSWVVTFGEALERQGPGPGTFPREAYGTAHPNVWGHNFYGYRVRCQLAKDKDEDGDTLLSPAVVFADGSGSCQ